MATYQQTDVTIPGKMALNARKNGLTLRLRKRGVCASLPFPTTNPAPAPTSTVGADLRPGFCRKQCGCYVRTAYGSTPLLPESSTRPGSSLPVTATLPGANRLRWCCPYKPASLQSFQPAAIESPGIGVADGNELVSNYHHHRLGVAQRPRGYQQFFPASIPFFCPASVFLIVNPARRNR